MRNINVNIKKESLVKLLSMTYITFIGLFGLGWLIYILAQNDTSAVFVDRIANVFSDFTQVIQFALAENPYQAPMSSSYPPLAISVIYFPFALICGNVAHLSNYEMLQTPQFWISYLLFVGIYLTVAALLFKKIVNMRGKSFFYFYLAVLFSGMILFMFIRGNIILTALVFVLFFLAFYKSENKFLRELALLSLAVAGAVKIYPLFLGVLILKEKKFFQAARVAVYSIILFLLPFLFFSGGFSNLELFSKNLSDFSFDSGRLLEFRSLSVAGIVYKFFYIFELIFNADLSVLSQIVSIIVIIALAVMSVAGAILSKNNFSVYMICATAILLIPPVSYYYSAIFITIPMAEFVNRYEEFSTGEKWFYLTFFIVFPCVALCPFGSLLAWLLIAALFFESVKNLKNYYGKGNTKAVSQGGKL